ncbi:STAS-like domain-containing protein [Marinobacterium stanieri]|uniref:DUF4325 domain-containing protein n=1 Tax=Marinobacterium stanieri TaxID=49186 RepID=A0A1N6QCK5_9GAMM|nr:STAS-like domain-containing protein [Marinobacterium stanieri]SIQ14340.1 protein of unknown function [Marinobacterium stanieri]
MTTKTISVVNDFNPRPYGRYYEDGEGSGQAFREKLMAPALREFDTVHIDLNGYNRYGRSFLDEAFGGLIREEGFTKSELDEKLSYAHDLVKSIEDTITDRIEAAARDCSNGD